MAVSGMTAKARLFLQMILGSAAIGLAGVVLAVYLTWPVNSLGANLKIRSNQARILRALEERIAREPDPLLRRFFEAWHAEEQGDLTGAIGGFRGVREATDEAGTLYVHASLRLGQSYGRNGEPDRELAVYQGLISRHPGASRLSQALFHLRRGERAEALALLETAVAQDAADGSLGHYAETARTMRDDLRIPNDRRP
jgi:tetratricopeptide (TPR) repeat protein